MKAILSVDLNWGIGYKGKLLQRVPEDMKFFRRMTTGKVVVMGRETFESLPGRQPLPDRINIILSRKGQFENDRLIVCRSLEELFIELKKYNGDDIYIIGGESVYRQMLPYCSEIYITRFEKEFNADRHINNLDKADSWRVESESERYEYDSMGFRFLKYVRQ